jgi:hypothetical protein
MDDCPAAVCTLKYTFLVPLVDDKVNEGAELYGCHEAPLNVEDSLAMYCAGQPVAALLSVTMRLVVDVAPLLIRKELSDGVCTRVMLAWRTDETPALFWTLKYTVFVPQPEESVKEGEGL